MLLAPLSLFRFEHFNVISEVRVVLLAEVPSPVGGGPEGDEENVDNEELFEAFLSR